MGHICHVMHVDVVVIVYITGCEMSCAREKDPQELQKMLLLKESDKR